MNNSHLLDERRKVLNQAKDRFDALERKHYGVEGRRPFVSNKEILEAKQDVKNPTLNNIINSVEDSYLKNTQKSHLQWKSQNKVEGSLEDQLTANNAQQSLDKINKAELEQQF